MTARDVIRPARDEDMPAISAVAQAAFGVHVPRLGRLPTPMLADYADLTAKGLVQVLDIDGGIAGFLVLIREPDALLLDVIAVSPQVQKRGLGRRLLSFADEAARAAGYSTIRLYTNAAMTDNIALYARCGYVETHRATENGRHRVYMQKPV